MDASKPPVQESYVQCTPQMQAEACTHTHTTKKSKSDSASDQLGKSRDAVYERLGIRAFDAVVVVLCAHSLDIRPHIHQACGSALVRFGGGMAASKNRRIRSGRSTSPNWKRGMFKEGIFMGEIVLSAGKLVTICPDWMLMIKTCAKPECQQQVT